MQQKAIKLDEFKKNYTNWLCNRNKYNEEKKLRHLEVLSEIKKLIKNNPDEAAKMLSMYYFTCGNLNS
jgi:hypothetical protein